MDRKKIALVAALAAAPLAWLAWPESATATQDESGMSMVTAEHKLFEKYAGTWTAEMESNGGPDMPAEKSAAKSTVRVACGGLWMVSDFEGSFMGMPFLGHEVTGYDPETKQYQLTWVDSMTPTAATGHGRFDAATKTFETFVKGKDAMGQMHEHRGTDVWTDADHHTWTMWMKGEDGKEFPAITIRYARKK